MKKILFTQKIFVPIILLIFAALLRFQTFGNPLLDLDEEFYLFVGGQLLEGQLPFVDIWDRKPFGLFAIYAFFHLFGPWRIFAYQIGALLCLWGTALCVRAMALTIASAEGAFAAALIYEIWPNLAHGEGGQAPIFYNLLVAIAMLLIVRRLPNLQQNPQECQKTGCLVMLLFGLSMQIKYTTVFEGIFAGIYLIWCLWKSGYSINKILLSASAWVLCAIIPTVSVFIFYFMDGYGHEWWFANIESIFHRTSPSPKELKHNILKMLIVLYPLLLGWIASLLLQRNIKKEQKPYFYFLNAWAVSAIVGVALFGTWFKHYALPIFVPVSIQIAPLFYNKIGRLFAIFLTILGTIWGQKILWKEGKYYKNQRIFNEIKNAISSSPPGCIFIYEGPVIIYDSLPYCRLTNHPFPAHFHSKIENNATGMDTQIEIEKILAQKPKYIITQEPQIDDENIAVRNMIYKNIYENYSKLHNVDLIYSSIAIYIRNNSSEQPSKSPSGKDHAG